MQYRKFGKGVSVKYDPVWQKGTYRLSTIPALGAHSFLSGWFMAVILPHNKASPRTVEWSGKISRRYLSWYNAIEMAISTDLAINNGRILHKTISQIPKSYIFCFIVWHFIWNFSTMIALWEYSLQSDCSIRGYKSIELHILLQFEFSTL